MKLATLRRRTGALPGISGVARLDRRTLRLAGRLNAGDIAVIDHVDLDRVTAEALVAARPAVIVNVQPSISGRYPNLGPQLIVASGIPLLDNAGPDLFRVVKEGVKVRLDGDTLYAGEEPLATGEVQDTRTVDDRMRQARDGLASQLEAFAVDTGEFMMRERNLLLEGDGIPQLRTTMTRRHAVVVVRSAETAKELKRLKPYIREYKPVLIGVDGGADSLLEAGLTPNVVVGDMDAVSDAALATGAEVVVHAQPDGRAPGLARVQDLGVDAITFPTTASSEDAALLLADEHDAAVVVAVGGSRDLTEFLDRGRVGMASSFLTRLRMGARLVDARSVAAIYRTRVSAAALTLLVVAALIAVIAALAVSDTGQSYLAGLHHTWNHVVAQVQGLFS